MISTSRGHTGEGVGREGTEGTLGSCPPSQSVEDYDAKITSNPRKVILALILCMVPSLYAVLAAQNGVIPFRLI